MEDADWFSSTLNLICLAMGFFKDLDRHADIPGLYTIIQPCLWSDSGWRSTELCQESEYSTLSSFNALIRPAYTPTKIL